MNFLRRVFANGLDADLIRLFRMLLPYKGLIALACIFLIPELRVTCSTFRIAAVVQKAGAIQNSADARQEYCS